MLYLECRSGISGDMTVAALIDLGADREKLEAGLKSLKLDGYRVETGRRSKCAIDACCFDVILDVPSDMHAHVHRNLRDITDIINSSDMTKRAKETALKIFGIVAEAESKVHGKPVDEVHFHEVGAVDSIVDIAAAAICLDDLDITEAYISELADGCGSVRCQHGILPVPVPAVAAIAERYGLYLKITDTEGEMVTPTGAAIAAALVTEKKFPETFRILKTGMGAGGKDFDHANILRAYIIEEQDGSSGADLSGKLLTLESNIDDTTGEALGYVTEKLMAAGARDACCIPAYMKKGRPAYMLKVICDEDKRAGLEDIIFRHTTTTGIRRYRIERTELPREEICVDTPYGKAKVKKAEKCGEEFYYPEYDDVARIADETGKPFEEIYEELRRLSEGK